MVTDDTESVYASTGYVYLHKDTATKEKQTEKMEGKLEGNAEKVAGG